LVGSFLRVCSPIRLALRFFVFAAGIFLPQTKRTTARKALLRCRVRPTLCLWLYVKPPSGDVTSLLS
jgi:hypothetical protein